MPTFDVVSEVDKHELTNAIDQANRELATRFDFKGTDAKFELEGFVVTQVASSAFQLKQMLDILRGRLSARGIDVRCLDVADPLENLGGARQKVTIKQGIEQPVAKKLIAAIKNAKLKVESQINGDKLRISGKKRDDLQTAIALLKKTDVDLPCLLYTSTADYRSATGEQRRVALSDGSSMRLNTASAVDVLYDADQRLVRLRAGEIAVHAVAEGGAHPRPFVVRTRQGDVQAQAARFCAREDGSACRVSVQEGAVTLRRGDASLALAAGEQAWLRGDEAVSYTHLDVYKRQGGATSGRST